MLCATSVSRAMLVFMARTLLVWPSMSMPGHVQDVVSFLQYLTHDLFPRFLHVEITNNTDGGGSGIEEARGLVEMFEGQPIQMFSPDEMRRMQLFDS